MTEILLGDWGTSRLRLWHCRGSRGSLPDVLAKADGPGIKFAGDPAAAFADCVARLGTDADGVPGIVAGMAGADIGWEQTPYVPCPVDWQAYTDTAKAFDSGGRRITLLAGLSSAGATGYRDVLRGEDVQLLGAIAAGELRHGRHVVCLPGTHSKWVVVIDGRVREFVTAVTGELFDVLRRHSILARGPATERSTDTNAFAIGASLALSAAEPALSQSLFAVRALTLSGELRDDRAAEECLSGLLVATDIRDVGLPLCAKHGISESVTVIGDAGLSRRYERVLTQLSIDSHSLDADACTIRGLWAAYRLREGCTADEI